MNSFDDDIDVDYDDGFDQYDVHPTKVRASGGGTNRSFHSGKGTRAKEAMIEKNIVRSQAKPDEKKKTVKKK